MQSIAHRLSAPVQVAPTEAALFRGRRNEVAETDRIGFDAWLLAPTEINAGERAIRLASQAAGPILLVATVAAGLSFII